MHSHSDARLRGVRGMAVTLSVVVAVGVAACGGDARPPAEGHSTTSPPASATLAGQLAAARRATAAYVTDLDAAKRDGYQIITPMIPEMGFHFLNPTIEGFDVSRPPILVYLKSGSSWQLGAVEWVFPAAPSTPPLDGATYGSFPAACHYADGTFIVAKADRDCAPTL